MAISYQNDSIAVSGVGVPQNGVLFPSGQIPFNKPGSQLCAFLASLNSSFGFNLSPHSFQAEFIPCGNDCDFHGASGQLPEIGTSLEFYVGNFLVRGSVTHADYVSSTQGTIVNLTIEDDRRILRRVKVHTEDLGENIPSGIVSVARVYRKVNGLTDLNGDPSDPKIKEYDRILQFGATYNQILQAIDYTFNEGKCSIPISDLPSAESLELNIGGSTDAIRFLFNLTTLDEVLSRVLQDTGFDWYWGMDNQKVNLINKKQPFKVQESELLDIISQFGSSSGINETKQISFGQDVIPDPTRFRLLGGHQEGIINSELLSPIDGLDTSALDGNIVFTKAWGNISIGFYDANGFYRTYIPSDKELQMALAGIEQWSYYKLYQIQPTNNDPPGFNMPIDDGYIAAQDPSFQSRLDPLMPLAGFGTGNSQSGIRVISNRRDEEHNWTIAWFNRVRSHASRHYGRSYVAEGILYNQASGYYRLIDAAWANVDNQVQGYELSASGTVSTSGVFVEDYEINRDLGPISPFVTDDFRVRAHCILPADTVYGPQGDDAPTSFGNWTEDAPPFNPTGDGRHYIPVDLTVVGQRVINPRSDDLYGFEQYPEGTLWCQLPAIAGPSSGLADDSILSNLATLLTTRNKIGGSGLRDIINPATLLEAYENLEFVAIPVQGRKRYGQDYPSQWVLGQAHYERDEDVQLDDQFVPWAFSPEGSETSLQIMTNRAIRRVNGKIVPESSSRYADFTQVGLPLISYDAFAEQTIGPSGLYGEISHGVNELNITFSSDGFTTRYKVQSYYPQFGREAPLGERTRAFLNGILNPIDFTDLELLNNLPSPPVDPLVPGDEIPTPIFFDDEKRAVKVTITEVNNVFTLSSTPGNFELERYRGLDSQLYEKPPSFGSTNKDFSEGALCIDGFLNIGDEALYHTDDLELPTGNVIFRYFTGGRSFGNGTIVEVQRTGSTNSSAYDVTIVDPTASDNGIERALFDVEVLNGTVSVGEKTTLAVQGDAPVAPGQDNASKVFIIGTSSAGAGVIPVEVVEVSGIGTSSAIALCREIDFDGDVLQNSGVLYPETIPIPFRELAASGDRGFLVQATVPNLFGGTSARNFVEIVKPGFFKFNG